MCNVPCRGAGSVLPHAGAGPRARGACLCDCTPRSLCLEGAALPGAAPHAISSRPAAACQSLTCFAAGAGCTFCSMVSAFGTFFMFLLGILIQKNYKWVRLPLGPCMLPAVSRLPSLAACGHAEVQHCRRQQLLTLRSRAGTWVSGTSVSTAGARPQRSRLPLRQRTASSSALCTWAGPSSPQCASACSAPGKSRPEPHGPTASRSRQACVMSVCRCAAR